MKRKLQIGGALCMAACVATAARAEIWAGGENGVIIHSGGAGQPWTAQVSGTTNDIRSIDFTDLANGWAVGNGGTVLHTTNGGTTWNAVSVPVNDNFSMVDFSDPLHGWLASGTSDLYKTVNGGTTWTPVSLPTVNSGTIGAAHFFDASEGWVSSATGLFHTTDGGAHWTELYANTFFLSLDVVNRNDIWAGDLSGTLYHSTDDGLTWQSQQPGTTSAGNLSFGDANDAWLNASLWYDMLRTTDGGATWNEVDVNPPLSVTLLDMVDGTHGYAFILNGSILYSTDGGLTFSPVTSPVNNTIRTAVNVVPEPASMSLIAFAGVALLCRRQRPRSR